MKLGELKVKTRKLINEFSKNGSIMGDSEGAQQDYLLRIPELANDAQMELSKICGITEKKIVTRKPVPGLLPAWISGQHLDADIKYSGVGARAYYFEVDGPCDVYLEEGDTELTHIEVTNIAGMNAYKGRITPSSSSATVTMRLSGDYPYNFRNLQMWKYSFASDDAVPDHAPWINVGDIDRFLELISVVRVFEDGRREDTRDFRLENQKEIWVPYDLPITLEISYFKLPAEITPDTSDEYEFEVPDDVAAAIAYYVGGMLVLDEDQVVSTTLLNKYESMKPQYPRETKSPERQIHDALGIAILNGV